MARYNLILADKVYVTLLQEAASQGLSLGKYVNIILREHAEQIERGESKKIKRQCEVCGRPVAYELFHESGDKTFRCKFHKPIIGEVVGYREIEN